MPGLVFAGAGLGLLVVPLVNVVLSAVPGEPAGGASGIFATAQQFGGVLGAAVVGTVFFDHAASGLRDVLGAAMPWVVGGSVVSAALCGALHAGPSPADAYVSHSRTVLHNPHRARTRPFTGTLIRWWQVGQGNDTRRGPWPSGVKL